MESLYRQLNKCIGKEIIISYYTNLRKLKTQTFKLISLKSFDEPSCMHMIVNGKGFFGDMYFFSQQTLIKSITISGEDTPIYFNAYIEENLMQSCTNPFEFIKTMQNAFFSNTPQNQILSERDKFLIKHYTRGKFKFEDLFFSEKQRQEFDLFFSLLIEDLTRYSKKNNLDSKIRKIDSGSTSIIYSIGDKIIKIGKIRDNSIIPYCEYLLQPIMNCDILFDNIPIRVEVTERIIAYKNLSEDDKKNMQAQFKQAVIEINKQLHKIGLRCYDLNINNIGILTKDNIIHFDTIPFQIAREETTSIKNNNGLQVRKKGEFVILDLDAIEIINYRKYCRYLKKIGYITEKTDKTTDFGKQLKIKYVD